MADDSTSVEKPRKKWRKRLLWLTAILCIIAWSINGPIGRWGVQVAIDKVLIGQGMAGDCSVRGTLARGFTLSDFDYSGSGGLQKIQFSEASADYRLLTELLHGQVRGITLSDANVVVDLEKFVPTESNEETSLKKLKQTANLVRTWVRQPTIQLSNTDVTILKSGAPFAEFQLASLHHDKQSDHYQLHGFTAKDSQYVETPQQDIKLTWTDSMVQLSRLEILPDITISEVHADWSSTLKGAAQLQFLSASIDVEISDHIIAQQRGGALDSKSLAQRFQLELPLDFSLDALDLRIDNWLSPIPNWKITGSTELSDIVYTDYQLTATKLNFQQHSGEYQLHCETQFEQAPLQAELSGQWTQKDAEKWWQDTTLHYQLSCPQLANIPSLLPELPTPFELSKTQITLEGDITITDLKLQQLDTTLNIAGATVDQVALPPLQIQGDYEHLKNGRAVITAAGESSPLISLTASYTFDSDSYQAELTIDENNPLWINKILAAYDTGLTIENTLNLHWKGKGHSELSAQQSGKIQLEPLTLTHKEQGTFKVSTGLDYQWPHTFTLGPLQCKKDDFSAQAKLHWDGNFLHLTEGEVFKEKESLSTISAKIPITTEIDSLESFLAQESPWHVDADLRPLQVQQIRQLLDLSDIKQMEGLEGSASLSVDLIGSPHEPEIEGSIKLEGLRGIANKDLAALHMLGEFSTENQRLTFSGVLNEAKTERMKLDLAIPFTPLQWVRKSENLDQILKESIVDGTLEINTLPLKRVARVVPQLKEITGHLHGYATITGNLLDPKVELDTRIEIPKLVIADDTVDDISDILIECKANSDRQVTATLKATVNGGLFNADAKVDLTQPSVPIFEINAKTNHAMVFRNDAISVRANAKIKLAGTLEDATLSGDIGFVESLFYKDIDILPIGVPSSAVSKVELPALDSKAIEIPIPEPFDTWKLNLNVRMQDPLLIRGNIAGGQIEGGFKATGTLGAPTLDGTIYTKDVVAKLPFSTLNIQKGKVTFHPRNGIIPTLDIQGKSMINNYDTSIFIYGLATAPKTTFTSFPPLPKNDIMTLLATGVTTQGLSNNTEAATLRALQLFLAKVKQESGQSRSTKILEVILSSIDEFEFNINETNGFTGRKYSSAKIKLNPRVYITAQVDEEKQTRGLIVFVLKFR